MNNEEKKWYDDWSYESLPASDNGLRTVRIKLPNSATCTYLHIQCASGSRTDDLIQLIISALTELSRRDKSNETDRSKK